MKRLKKASKYSYTVVGWKTKSNGEPVFEIVTDNPEVELPDYDLLFGAYNVILDYVKKELAGDAALQEAFKKYIENHKKEIEEFIDLHDLVGVKSDPQNIDELLKTVDKTIDFEYELKK